MSERGVFAVDRGIWDHPSFANEPLTEREAWQWLIGEASFKTRTKRIGSIAIELARGQVAASLRFMADKWQWSEPRVRRFLKRLKTDAMIDAATDAGITVITICNYNKYQRVSLPTDAAALPQDDAAATQQRRKEEDTKDIETPSLRSGVPAKPKRSAKARSQLPELWQPDEQDVSYAVDRGFAGEKLRQLSAAFANHHRSKGNLMADWHAAWRTWCDNEIKFNGGRNGHSNGSVHANSGTQQSGSTAVFAGVAAAAERRARERNAAGQQRPIQGHPDPAEGSDLELFGEVGSAAPHS